VGGEAWARKLAMISMAQNFKSAIKLQFPAIWKLLAEFGVQIPLGSKPRKLFQQEIICSGWKSLIYSRN
jgi:hypothetical protein